MSYVIVALCWSNLNIAEVGRFGYEGGLARVFVEERDLDQAEDGAEKVRYLDELVID